MWDEKKIRIVDIAEELGVSTATVSHVIHGKKDRVSRETEERIQRKLEERGYIPNMAATLLAQNNSRIIAVVIKNHPKYEGRLLEDPFIAGAVNALSDAIESAGCFMMLKKADQVREIVRFASMWNLDGMVVLSFCEDEYQQLRAEIRIPFVVYDGFFENRGRICNLVIDDFDGGRQVGNHLRALGHRKVLCLADNAICMDQLRYEGFCEGMKEKTDRWLIPMSKAQRIAFYQERIPLLRAYTAVFAVSDYYAAELMMLLQKNGMRVPEDISIAGFDGSSLCRQVNPTLTSVEQDHEYRAQLAVELIRKMREDRDYTANLTIPVRLRAGESTGKARRTVPFSEDKNGMD